MEALYKIVYSPEVNRLIRPLSKQVFRLTNKMLVGISGKISVTLEDFKFDLFTNQTSSVGQELFYKGAENYEFTPLFSHLIKQSAVFLDIGANIGYFSIIGSKLNPKCKILAFEPSVGSLHFLKKNVAANKCVNVTIIDKAISNIEGKLTFHEVKNAKYPWLKYNLNGSNSLDATNLKLDHTSFMVEVTTIEKSLNENNLTSVDLIKLDTECTEHWIIENSLSILNNLQPVIISEIYPVIEKEIESLVLEKMPEYLIFHYRTNNHTLSQIKSFSDLKKGETDRNFVLCPKSKLDRIQKFIQ